MKTVHFHLYDPTAGPHLFGKPKANTPTEYQTVTCDNHENCPLLKKGECVMVGGFLVGKQCPYGKYHVVKGPTKRARSFYSWQSEQREKFKGVPYLKHPPKKLLVIGEFVFLPYAHMNMNESLPYKSHGGAFRNGTDFLRLEDFTCETVKNILDFRPQAFFGGEITSYRTDELPKFFLHLKEELPDLFGRFVEKYPNYAEVYKAHVSNHVGRTALVKTINPCSFTTKGYEGKYKVTWKWDGKKLTTDSPHAFGSWGKVDDYESLEVSVVPSDKTTMVITDNSQVNENTVFVD